MANLLNTHYRIGYTVNRRCADIAFLATHFGEEHSLVCDDEELPVLLVDFEDLCFARVGIETEEFGGRFGA